MLKTFTLAIAGTTTALVATPANAEPATETHSVGISFRDLDLSSEAGREELDRRVENAAKEACGMNEHEVGSRISSREARRCVEKAKRDMAEFVAEVTSDKQSGG